MPLILPPKSTLTTAPQDWGNLGPYYVIHAREHFVVNLSAAGGLMLLSSIGAGKYSVDEYMKKHD